MSVVVKIDPNGGTQRMSGVIPDATPTQDGAMTKTQVQQLAALAGGGGGVGKWNVTAVQSSVTFNASANDLVQCSNVVLVVLPTAVGAAGKVVGVKDVTGFNHGLDIQITTTGGETIDGASALFLSNINNSNEYSAAIFVSDGANWFVGYAFRGYASGGRAVVDADATLTPGDFLIAFTSLTAARVLTGAPTDSPTAPRFLYVKDETGNASVVNTITFTPSSGLIDGLASKVIVNSAYGSAILITNGTNWFTL